ncbi:MAG: hypothetical protein UT63_C0006G0004 [Candidatus Gottesmanbacteria bacterium GW2011_GWC2_39_8]|uniref:Beta-ketoacyl-[acyl-carrier-protein] synthase III C-terminal domain-containing protein n=1 Tax=Candidatus Gottesmanbacteria bacterium GW2011_GWC2_39_8 TaxID=1618450 RepID=A0A0G0Q9U9_9BACT|nr:MAG: hypothetical protein UT63_C0006G0004 [Candidatus Gottesmanbacteria bacterium GW2011_GWC2_39_8]
MVGIVGYGSYIPKYRIKTTDIADVWKKDGGEISSSLGVSEKAVAGIDEDAVTLAVEAGRNALLRAGIEPLSIGGCFVGSESHPYAVNPTSTIVGDILGFGNNYMAADLEFACKAATAGMQALSGLVASGYIKYGMAIGSDTAQARPHDVLEYTAGAASSAFILGGNKSEFLAEIVDFISYTSDTPDFWRRDGIRYPSHGGRFTGEPAYFSHVISAAEKLLKKTHLSPSDFDHAVFHMPNGKFPKIAAKRLGFTPDQIKDSLIVNIIGNPYSASALTGFSRVLDVAGPDEKIFFVSYGSGAGADAFIFQTTPLLSKKRKLGPTVDDYINDKEYITYPEFLKKERKI